MGSSPTKAAANIYCKCRIDAANGNDRLKSREGASEELGISPSSLADYELGISDVPADKVLRMADLYNAPELLNHYCTQVCPIGKFTTQKLELNEFERITLRLLSAFKHMDGFEEALLDIAEDGRVSETEKPVLRKLSGELKEFSKRAQELELWMEKNLKEE